MEIQLYNTPHKSIEVFNPIEPDKVRLYTCGPTVYDHLHIGNWAAYVYWDVLVRLLSDAGYEVNRVMNITDVGHLVSDADEGEDKLEKGARREGRTAWEIADYYTESFLKGSKKLNLIPPNQLAKATDYIEQQLELVRQLKTLGYTYQISDGIYFDTSKFERYGDFAGLNLESQKAGARVEYNTEKKNPTDFAVWKFTPAGKTRDMEWETPADLLENEQEANAGATRAIKANRVVMGFPGWHLECSAIAMSLLGNTLDIHTGGIDHIPVHHTNEVAQSESATKQTFSNFWLHNNHLKSDGTKISKSLGNGYTLEDLESRGFDPLDYRLLVLQSHYRSESNFSFENLESARNRRHNWRNIAALRHQTHQTTNPEHPDQSPSYAASGLIKSALADDMATPQALQVIDEVFGELGRLPLDRINRDALIDLLTTIDSLLGVNLIDSTPDISDQSKQLILARGHARDEKDWNRADEIRQDLEAQGILVRDTPSGPVWEYI